jgi:predicted PurR-regulated permease PerM
MVTKSIESSVITPLVQDDVNNARSALILTVHILGGALAGVMGLI